MLQARGYKQDEIMAENANAVCANTGIYESLTFCKGKTILPGIRDVYVQSKNNIVKWPELPEVGDATITKMKELAVLKGDFTLASDQYWLKVDLAPNKGNITSEVQGEKPYRTFLNKTTLTHPGTSEDAAGFARQAAADELVFLIQQRDGKFRVMGSEKFDIDIKPGQDTGEGTTGESVTTLEVEATDECPAPFYPGKIQIAADSYISGENGKPVTKTT